jgi:translation initiation factor 2 subunit 1
MLYKREGYPEEGELLLCTVTKVQYHSVFCDLDEFNRKSGMIHISEVSPGRIRNIRDYVKEGKKVVCLVLKINEEKGHIDLSLRRVNENQKRRKMDAIKQEQKAEKIVEMLANDLEQPLEKVYKDISKLIFKEYEQLHLAFNEVVENDLKLESLGLEKTVAKKLEELVKDKIKPKEVIKTGELSLVCYSEDGLEIVKSALEAAEGIDDSVTIKYEGGGNYLVRVVAKDYKVAEKTLDKAFEAATNIVEKNNGVAKSLKHEK